MTKKNKIIMIAAIVAAVVLIVVGIIIAAVLNNGYLDSLKKYDMESSRVYNDVEILEKDGLYYLTKDGKKIVKTGYSYLESVNDYYFDTDDNYDLEDYVNDEDFELYDWYLARKPKEDVNFLVNTEGDEIAIAGENLEVESVYLPYVVYYDTVTYQYGALSLKSFDSDLSANAGEEISLTMFDYVGATQVNEDAQNDYVVTYKGGDGSTVKAYMYFDVNGAKLFESAENPAASYDITVDKVEGTKTRFFVNSVGDLYNFAGELVASDVEMANVFEGRFLSAKCAPVDEALTAEDNAANVYWYVASATASIKMPVKEYNIEASTSNGNMFILSMKNADGTDSTNKKLFNMSNGESKVVFGVSDIGNGIIRVALTEAADQFAYIETDTCTTLISTKYDDMVYVNGYLASAKELAETGASAKAQLHFVAPGKTDVSLTLGVDEEISPIVVTDECSAYVITTTTVGDGGIAVTKKAVYAPFATGSVKTAAYDKVEYLDVFADAIGVVIATDYEAGKFDFIDTATGNVIKTVNAAGADMAKTNFYYMDTYDLRQDNAVEESSVEYALIMTVVYSDASTVASTDATVFSRNNPMTKDETVVASALTAVELGKNIQNVESYDGHLVVYTTVRTSTVYEVSDSYALDELAKVDYRVIDVVYYGTDIDEVYFVVEDEKGNEGLCADDGDEILDPVYDWVQVVDEKYAIVSDKDAYGAFKLRNSSAKQIIEFIYEEIDYLGDGGFYASANGEDYIFDEDKLLKGESLVNDSIDEIVYITYNEDSGKYEKGEGFSVNYGGKLYIHRPDTKEVVANDYYNYEAMGHEGKNVSISQSGVKVINYRNADGSLIETKIVYPTAKGLNDYILTDNWYRTPVKDLQTTPVTEADVEADSGIINLYKAPDATAGLAG